MTFYAIYRANIWISEHRYSRYYIPHFSKMHELKLITEKSRATLKHYSVEYVEHIHSTLDLLQCSVGKSTCKLGPQL